MAGTKATFFTSAHGRRQAGFSLLELFVAVAIAALVLGMALPNFREAAVRNTTTGISNELVGDLNYARAEAVKRGTQVRVIPTTSALTGWKDGWQIEAMDPATSTYITATPLRKHAAIATGYGVKGLITTGGTANAVEFNGTGALIATLTNGYTLVVCRSDNKLAQSRRVDVGGSGIVTSRRDATGAPTTCP
jgi:type IV fimbrial biogenesis protein FimT